MTDNNFQNISHIIDERLSAVRRNISLNAFTVSNIESGTMPVNSTSFTIDRITPGMINRYKFENLPNGTYYILMTYTNELGTGYSNLLSFTIDDADENAELPDIPGYPTYFLGMIMLISIVSLARRSKSSTK